MYFGPCTLCHQDYAKRENNILSVVCCVLVQWCCWYDVCSGNLDVGYSGYPCQRRSQRRFFSPHHPSAQDGRRGRDGAAARLPAQVRPAGPHRQARLRYRRERIPGLPGCLFGCLAWLAAPDSRGQRIRASQLGIPALLSLWTPLCLGEFQPSNVSCKSELGSNSPRATYSRLAKFGRIRLSSPDDRQVVLSCPG